MRFALLTSVRALLGAMTLAALLGAAGPAPPGQLLAEAQAAEQHGQRALARSKLERLLDEYDGTPEAVTGANDLLHILYAQWTDPSATGEQMLAALDALASRARWIGRSKTYARGDAAVLRRDVLTFATWVGASLASTYPPKCAEHYLDMLAWLAPDDPGFPSILMHAAICLDAAGMPTEAVAHAERVIAEYPRHDTARLARPLLAGIARAHARFTEAAGHAEAHARRYPDDPQTPDLLADAYTIRRGLGDDSAAQDALERHARAPTPGDPDRAAAMFHAHLARDWPLDDAAAYLRRHREHMTLDQQIVLAARIAQLRWRGACDKGLLHDLCIGVMRPGGTVLCEYDNYAGRLRRLKTAVATPRAAQPRPSPQRCIDEKTRLFLFPRDRKRAASAQRELARLVAAAASAEVPEYDPQRRQRLDDTLAMAAVYAADQRLEALLAIDLPAGLSFAVDEHPRGAAGQRRHTQQLRARALARAPRGASGAYATARVGPRARLRRHRHQQRQPDLGDRRARAGRPARRVQRPGGRQRPAARRRPGPGQRALRARPGSLRGAPPRGDRGQHPLRRAVDRHGRVHLGLARMRGPPDRPRAAPLPAARRAVRRRRNHAGHPAGGGRRAAHSRW